MIRTAALAAVTLALVLGATGCGEESPAPVGSAPATTAPTSAMPDRSFAEPTEGAGTALTDYTGTWRAVTSAHWCEGAPPALRLHVDEHGATVVVSDQLWASFAGPEVVDGRWVGHQAEEPSGVCGSADLRLEIDCTNGVLAFYDGAAAAPLTEGRARRCPAPAGGACTL